MKASKRIFITILVFCLAIVAVCPAIYAGAVSVKTIAEDTYIKVSSTNYIYKITVAEEGYITVSGKLTKKSVSYPYGYADFTLLNSKKQDFTDFYPDYVAVSTSQTTGSVKYPVSKGTYYISVKSYYNSSNSVNIYVKYKFTPVKTPTNYCIGNAISLNSGKTAYIYQTPQKSFDRWYKINLTTSKKIKITTNASINVYDKDGNRVNTNYVSSNIYETIKVASGTYYIRVESYNHPFECDYNTLKWS